VGRNRAHSESDIDIVCVFKDHLRSGEPVDLRERESGLHVWHPSRAWLKVNVVGLMEACGRELSWLCIWQGHDWAWGNVRLEALLSSRTIYGDCHDIEHLRADGKKIVQEGLEKFGAVTESVKKIKEQVQTAQTLEVRWFHRTLEHPIH
jgi:hypothetical protein